MLESTILCQTCKKELKSIGGESAIGNVGFNEHYFCEKCQVNIDIAVRFNKTEEDEQEKKNEPDR